MLSLHTVITAFLLVFVAELGDKTQLAAFSLAATTQKPGKIFIASTAALVCSTVIAALIGKLTARIVPQFTSYIAGGLFVVFGFIMLFSKETSLIEDCFVKVLALEQAAKRVAETRIAGTRKMVKEEENHIQLLDYLIHYKKFFEDNINREPELAEIYNKIDGISDDFSGLSQNEMWDKLLSIEQAAIDFYRYLYNHLERDEHEEGAIQEDLSRIIGEEQKHFRFYENKTERESKRENTPNESDNE